ncbi:MAG: MarR family transcriptional regulator [Rhodospirillaceae bacterium]
MSFKQEDYPCLCISLRRSERIITDIYNESLKGTGLLITQFSLLVEIRKLECPSMKQLADVVGLDRSTLARNLSLLEATSFVRLRDGDQRNKIVELTASGRSAIERATPKWREAEAEIQRRLGSLADKIPKMHYLLEKRADG